MILADWDTTVYKYGAYMVFNISKYTLSQCIDIYNRETTDKVKRQKVVLLTVYLGEDDYYYIDKPHDCVGEQIVYAIQL